MAQPLILDTDIGSDIDDALALAYLLNEPECDLLGVTAVTGNTAERAALAEWICREAGRSEIPVFRGLEGPLLNGPGQPNTPQFAALPEGFESRAQPEAIRFLRQTIRDRPGEVTLLAIGPLTNVATLFLVDPEIPSLLKELVLMGGSFDLTEPGRRYRSEWNCRCDPVAAAVVFARSPLRTAGLDVTLQVQIPRAELLVRFPEKRGAMGPTLAMLEHWGHDLVTFHDPLAAAMIFHPELCQSERGEAKVDIVEGDDLGRTNWSAEPNGRHQAARKVAADRFFEVYLRATGGNQSSA